MSTITSDPPKSPAAQTSPPRSTFTLDDQRIAIRGLSWELYDRLSDAIGERQPIFLAYDGKDLEIMTKGLAHEDFKELLGRLVHAITDDLHVLSRGLGETTWKREPLKKGLEADQCYFFRKDKLEIFAEARARKSNDLADYPNPDLAIEVEMSPSEIDKPAIYRALQVAELWHFDGETLSIEQLGADGIYVPTETSRFLPIRADEIRHWVLEEDTNDLPAWRDRLRAWNLSVLAPRMRS